MSKNLISVIIPIYNVEEFLSKCIDSVLAQTYKNLEVILVNDGSPDNCASICNDYSINDNRIIVINKENGGLSDARNAGLDAAKGEYVIFIDSDDFIDENFVEILYDNIGDADMSFCDFKYYNNDKEFNINILTEFNVERLNRSYLLANISSFRSSLLIVAWNKLYKKKIWDGLRYPKGKVHEDEFVAHHVLDRCNEAVFCDTKLYYYRQRAGSITTTVSNEKWTDVIAALDDRKNFFVKKEMDLEALNAYRLKYVVFLRKDFSNKNSFYKKLSFIKIIFDSKLGVGIKSRLLCKKVSADLYYYLCRVFDI